jgi:hypothetical protein
MNHPSLVTSEYKAELLRWLCALLLLSAASCGGTDSTVTDGDLPVDGTDNVTATDGTNETDGADGTSAVDSTSASTETDSDPIEDDGVLRITNVDPSTGATKGGDVVTIVGSGFIKDEMVVAFGESLALEVFFVSGTRLTATTPPGSPGLTSVTVTNPAAEQTATLEAGFRYVSPVVVTKVEPNVGILTGGEPITVRGSGFSQGNAVLLIGDKLALSTTVLDDTQMTAITPAGQSPGPVDVHLTNDEGQTVLEDGFSYYEYPVLDLVTPGAGPVAGGTEVTLTGRGFVEGTTVRFGENEAVDVTVASGSTITAVTPAGLAGPTTVTVETDYGFGGLPGGYTYMDIEPENGVTIVGLQPTVGDISGGDEVAITVYGLGLTEDTSVTFDGIQAEIVSVSPSSLLVLASTPPHDVGTVDVGVTTAAGSDVIPDAFTYAEVLGIKAVSPSAGPVEGGTDITLDGSGFGAGLAVQVGALPCANVSVISSTEATCTTPAGSPGPANVVVTMGVNTDTLASGFFYETGSLDLYVVEPDTGSQAGGTYTRLLGVGFEPGMDIRFDGNPATHIDVEDSTLAFCKTPPGTIGTVDVTITTDAGTTVLPQSFTYFDPLALFGGTWGESVEGAVNVTVLDAGNGNPVPDAFVLLAVDPDTPYQGFSNTNGQVTFSGPDVLGEQMVSASKEGYASTSVVEFNAENITIYLVPLPTPSAGGFPPGATISGQVFGLGKYVIVPPGKCTSVGPQPNGQCTPCDTDADCTGGANTCSTIGTTGTFCTVSCTSDAQCGSAFKCMNLGGEYAQCVPNPGEKQARCYVSVSSIFSPLPDNESANIVPASGTYTIGSGLGEKAVICLGGVVDPNDANPNTNFTPLAMGVKRHINVAEGSNPNHDVVIEHILNRTITIRLDDPPLDQDLSMVHNAALLFWDFGSDGGFMHRTFQEVKYGLFGADGNLLSIPGQPQGWTGNLYDARYTILGLTANLSISNPDQLPASFTLIKDLKNVVTDQVFELTAGEWESKSSGVTRTVTGLWGFAENDVWGVGVDGTILRYNGLGWNVQSSPVSSDLWAIWGSAPDDMWAVGADTILHFDGVVWTEIEGPNTTSTPEWRTVWGHDGNIWIGGGNYNDGVWRYNGSTWTSENLNYTYIRDLHGLDASNRIAVGRNGSIRAWNGNSWNYQSSGSGNDLFGVHMVSKTEAYAVGEGGTILRYDGTTWTAMNSPTDRTLRAVWAAGPDIVYAVGDASTLLYFDGTEWTEQSFTAKTTYNSLLALWGDANTLAGFAMGTSEVLMGPMLRAPEQQTPENEGVMTELKVGFDVKDGVDAHFNQIVIAIPGLSGPQPIWSITTDGDVFNVDLPDFENIEGTPGVYTGLQYLTIRRVYKENFTIDNYDLSDLNTASWRSWSIDTTTFTK